MLIKYICCVKKQTLVSNRLLGHLVNWIISKKIQVVWRKFRKQSLLGFQNLEIFSSNQYITHFLFEY